MVVAASLIAAYLLSLAYASLVNTTSASTYAGMIAGDKGLYALAVANPVFTGPLLIAAILVTTGALIYMNYSKADQIDEVKKAVLEACEKDDQGNPDLQNKKIKIANKNDPA
ncbi:hypothetical protein IHO40_03075 [Wolbachia endosymbiont of Mansonella ozzardi]|uniref:hypothetical protein n=1 Tax=Wolbachia endosymbiont of Mansonella ozzardi TaxID=137464 RepID=UPI001CE18D74|nr:hypothetical protein [Wolbachia endosymbiont of Mansonella ozzardi]MCA4775085.1 hypothetical protein [Wolbachia endosymbiont of Mansonella ozzardi]